MSAATIDKVGKWVGKIFEFYLVNENHIESQPYIDDHGNEWRASVEGTAAAVLSFLDQESIMTCNAQPLSPEEAAQAKKAMGEQAIQNPQHSLSPSSQPGYGNGVDCSIQATLVKPGTTGPLRVTWQIDPPLGSRAAKSHTINLGQPTSGSVSVNTTLGSVDAVLADNATGTIATVQSTTSSQLSGWFQSGVVNVTVTGAGSDNYYTLSGVMTVF